MSSSNDAVRTPTNPLIALRKQFSGGCRSVGNVTGISNTSIDTPDNANSGKKSEKVKMPFGIFAGRVAVLKTETRFMSTKPSQTSMMVMVNILVGQFGCIVAVRKSGAMKLRF